MSALSARHVWTYRLIFVLLSLAIISLRLLPLEQSSLPTAQPNVLGDEGTALRTFISNLFASLPGPDILVLLTFAWVVRQPTLVPFGLMAAVFLLADFLFLRPPGLWTLLMVLASESVRRKRLTMTELPFLVEWGGVALAIMSMVLLNRLFLWMLLVDLDSLGLTLAHAIVTILTYPFVVGISKFVFGLRKLGPTELEAL